MKITLKGDDALNIVKRHGGDVSAAHADPLKNPSNTLPESVSIDVEVDLSKDGLDNIAKAAKKALEDEGMGLTPPPGNPFPPT